MSTVEELYSAAEKLSAAPKDEARIFLIRYIINRRNHPEFGYFFKNSVLQIMKLQSSYEVILSGVKGDSSCKRLASQFISRFFARFPNSASRGLDAVLDLCEGKSTVNVCLQCNPFLPIQFSDDDVNIRKQAIKVQL